MNRRKVILLLLLILCIGIASFSGYQVLTKMHEYSQGEDIYENLLQYVSEGSSVDTKEALQEAVLAAEPDDYSEADYVPVVDFESLTALYPDVVGWISIDDTVIDYPILQAEDNDYYLKRLPDGTWNSSGSIFMDYRNDPDFTDRNTIIYGHNMRNNAMFAELMNYKEQAYYDSHPTVMIYTPSGEYRMEVFAGYVTNSDADAWQLDFADSEEFLQWCEDVAERSCFESSVMPERFDSVITLSTCSYEFDEARFVLHGVLVADVG